MWFKSHYTRHLEEEVARLRAENRAMLNSLLARSGFPPIDLAAAGAPAKKAAHGQFARGEKGGGAPKPWLAPKWNPPQPAGPKMTPSSRVDPLQRKLASKPSSA